MLWYMLAVYAGKCFVRAPECKSFMRTDVNPYNCPLVEKWVQDGDTMRIWSNGRLSGQG